MWGRANACATSSRVIYKVVALCEHLVHTGLPVISAPKLCLCSIKHKRTCSHLPIYTLCLSSSLLEGPLTYRSLLTAHTRPLSAHTQYQLFTSLTRQHTALAVMSCYAIQDHDTAQENTITHID